MIYEVFSPYSQFPVNLFDGNEEEVKIYCQFLTNKEMSKNPFTYRKSDISETEFKAIHFILNDSILVERTVILRSDNEYFDVFVTKNNEIRISVTVVQLVIKAGLVK